MTTYKQGELVFTAEQGPAMFCDVLAKDMCVLAYTDPETGALRYIPVLMDKILGPAIVPRKLIELSRLHGNEEAKPTT